SNFLSSDGFMLRALRLPEGVNDRVFIETHRPGCARANQLVRRLMGTVKLNRDELVAIRLTLLDLEIDPVLRTDQCPVSVRRFGVLANKDKLVRSCINLRRKPSLDAPDVEAIYLARRSVLKRDPKERVTMPSFE